ncbi:MAG: hypothetical protein ICV66_11455 [Chitinophagaceae bacterium]|nr:hypothetical protein [Chitinophagaceae bacterium]
MKVNFIALLLLFALCANSKERIFIGSTPAHAIVRSFLGIPLADSIDFIRWKVVVQDNKYHLQCNYGIGKPNTDGFINGGKNVELHGKLTKEKNYYHLQNGNKRFSMLEFNPSLLHLLNNDKSLLVGNGGWSYTLNNSNSASTRQINIHAVQTAPKDSMAFEGRTPCHDFPEAHPATECIKMKWYIVLYADPKTQQPTTYHLNGTYNRQGGKRGNWKITKGSDGRIIYQLYSDKENAYINLLKLDENILVFVDEQEKLLVGDRNFSFTLNRRW